MSKYFQKPSFRVVLIMAGIAIALLTVPSYNSYNPLSNGNTTIQQGDVITNNALKPASGQRAIVHHNFLASYFIQESSFDRTNQRLANESAVAATMLKVPVSVAFNVWMAITD